jgi:S-adenosylmethionine:tRNA ribosyltransferase-isomerase
MKVADFDFTLPEDRIAQRPCEPRDAARLLHVAPDALIDRSVRDLPGLMAPGDVLVFNDTRVIPARLSGKRDEVSVSVTLMRNLGGDRWSVLAKPGKRLRVGDRVDFGDRLTASVDDKAADGMIALTFQCADGPVTAAIEALGAMPLPPYIRGGRAETDDRDRYQTVYAARDGAVAAPTAGLHFTPDLLAALDAAGVERAFVTLHVGAGTFQPVKVEDTDDHAMHSETGEIPAEVADRLNQAKAAGRRIVAIGTTSLRLLESAAAPNGEIRAFAGDTDIFITPGYRFRAVDRLMTNFHLPRSTLFMLVCAFSGTERMKAAYAHAVDTGYRFYSYGDACLLDPSAPASGNGTRYE